MPRTGRPKGSKKKGVLNGLSSTRLYETWRNMINRCKESNPHYGGRGITVCEEWHDFLTFYDWAITNGYSDNLTIERINVDGNYCPENCTWKTFKEQQSNKTTSRYITIGDVTKTLTEWSRDTGICDETIRKRIKLGWSGEDLIKPVRK